VMPSACANSSWVSPRRLLKSRMTGASLSTCSCPPGSGGEQDECHGGRPCGRWIAGRCALDAAAKVATRCLSVAPAEAPLRV
jgi:hypothetical protein